MRAEGNVRLCTKHTHTRELRRHAQERELLPNVQLSDPAFTQSRYSLTSLTASVAGIIILTKAKRSL